MRPFMTKQAWLGFPIFAAVGGSFGYWLEGVDQRQTELLQGRKASIIEKRARRAAREAQSEEATA